MAQGDSRKRVVALSLMVALYLLAVALGAHSFPAYTNASGVEDLGHYYVPSLLGLFGRERAEYIWWLGTLPLELFFVGITLVVLLTGRGIRLALCLYVTYFLHWLFLHATTLPPPDHMVWEFPPGVFTLGKPYVNDLWFSGHTANAVLIALATAGSRRWVRALAWVNVPFQILLVLSARTHYTIDVLGAVFVAVTVDRVSHNVRSALAGTPAP